MSKKKRKILKMSEQDYNNYLMALKDEKPILPRPTKKIEKEK